VWQWVWYDADRLHSAGVVVVVCLAEASGVKQGFDELEVGLFIVWIWLE
jgi:hypothetical protein